MTRSNIEPGGVEENDVVQHLRSEGPATSDELPRPPSAGDKNWIGVLDVSSSSTGGSKSRGRTTSVYYLYGDE
ncbi:MAG: hypothetical protein SV760_00210, partial [Halobacteria archaeon]|nr:hypothetical protein [Halobacteria archaeon]